MSSPSPRSSTIGGHRVADSPRRGRLAVSVQEALTSVARLRSNRQVAHDAEGFRLHIKQVLAIAEQDARAAGYASEDVRFALFAVIVFLDESVLNAGQPMFANWPSRPLQEELFGGHMGGELFFQYLQQLLARPDSPDLADIVEVYLLCLLMGFRGRYGSAEGNEIPNLMRQLTDTIDRVRGKAGELSPRWRPSQSDIARRRDRWVPRLAVAAATMSLIAVGLFAWFTVSLRSNAAELRGEIARMAR